MTHEGTLAYIEDIARHEGQRVVIRGWLHNRRSSGKIHFLTIRDGSGFIQGVMSKAAVDEDTFRQRRPPDAGNVAHRVGHGARRRARAGRLRDRRGHARGRRPVGGLPDHAEGARRRLPDGPPPPLDPHASASTPILRVRAEVIAAVRGVLRRPRLHPRRHADLHAGGLRGHDDAVPGPVLRRRDGVPHAERPALQRGRRHGARPGLLLRPDVPRREVEDAPPPDRVLDGRARGRLRRRSTTSWSWPRTWSSTSCSACSSAARPN